MALAVFLGILDGDEGGVVAGAQGRGVLASVQALSAELAIAHRLRLADRVGGIAGLHSGGGSGLDKKVMLE